MTPTLRRVAGFALLFVLLGGPGVAEEEAATSDLEARQAVTAFGKAWKKKDPEVRLAAVRELGALDHAKIADRLFKALGKAKNIEVQIAIYEGLANQRAAAKKVLKKLRAALFAEAEDAKRRIRKGDLGFRLDPRTGEADVDSEEGQRVLAEAEARGRRTQAALEAFLALTDEPPKDADDLVILLQDPHDALVVSALGAFAGWNERGALAGMLELYRMYPEEYRWETGEVIQAGGTDATAKAEWMSRFGHPNKQRKRPEIVQALRAALETMTGEAQETPEALQAWMEARGMRIP